MEFPTYDIELELKDKGYKYIVGVDEAGRGPGAGPVVAAAVNIPLESVSSLLGKVNDSKKLTAKKRDALYDFITENCVWGMYSIDADIIDEINILEATKVAMQAAVHQINSYDFILIDGTVDMKKLLPIPQRNIIKGDATSISIAAASVVAKVSRDHMMEELHDIFPIYDWNKNKGYLTKKHIEAIQKYGITEFHRASFKKVGR
jgi:ribonuclease HII